MTGFLLRALAGVLPMALVSVAIAALLFRPLVIRLGTSPVVAGALLLTAIGIAVVTLTRLPGLSSGGPQGGWGGCLQAGWQPTWVPWPLSGSITGRSLNVWMFFPLGLFGALTGVRRGSSALIPAATLALGALAPFCIEAAQRSFPLGRLCDTRDIADNVWGLVLGAVVGLVVRAVMLRTQPREAVAVQGASRIG